MSGQEQRAARAPGVDDVDASWPEIDDRCEQGGGYHYGCSCYTPLDELVRVREELRVARETASALVSGLEALEHVALLAVRDGRDLGAANLAEFVRAIIGRPPSTYPSRDDDPVHDVRDDFAPDGLAVRP